MNAPASQTPEVQRRHRRVAFAVTGVVMTMTGLSFASVPLYDLFCRMTGYGGTTQVATQGSATRGERMLTVRFDANVDRSLPWGFEPETPAVKVRTGETQTVFYKVTNRSDREWTATATYNVAPDQAGIYFTKISCFCFTEQTLQPGESMDMPVVFFLDPALEKEETLRRMHSVTLSYTFMTVKNPSPLAAVSSDNKPRL